MMKHRVAVMMLALPLSISVLAKSASAAEFKAAPNATRSSIVAENRDRPDRNRPQPPRREEARRSEVRRVWVPGHWQNTPRGRQWIPAHYETRR